MKKVFFPLCLMLMLASCTTVAPLESMEASYLIKVECKPDVSSRNTVLFLLRQARARDIKETKDMSSLSIEAAYYKSDNELGRLQQIEDDLKRSGSVIDVQLIDNPCVVRANR